ncbi:hypothetical protein [Pygmaiobacter massiliensis]|uniref:hypothetical protein n=1 Tax=Pygmaiobacter massiliensis TaxID=1917873 RepID=UPI002898E345|nr:hypothetical protein [Pygmaiobacter massiliensis]
MEPDRQDALAAGRMVGQRATLERVKEYIKSETAQLRVSLFSIIQKMSNGRVL